MLRVLLLTSFLCLFCTALPAAAREAPEPTRIEAPGEDGPVRGDLWLPAGDGPFPAVVLIPGAGPQPAAADRAAPGPAAPGPAGFQTCTSLAPLLASRGIAALLCYPRVDADITLAQRAADVEAMLRVLPGRKEIDAARIGLCGHSQGGMTAPLVASRSPQVRFLVLLSPPCLPTTELALSIFTELWRDLGAPEEENARMRRVEGQLLAALREGKSGEPFRAELLEVFSRLYPRLPAGQKRLYPDAQSYARAMVEPQLKLAERPSARFLLSYDPEATLQKLHCPVLALFGERDNKVPFAGNRRVLLDALAAAGTADAAALLVPRADHALQEMENGPTGHFTPGFEDLVTGWIKSRTSLGRGTTPAKG